LSLTNTIVVCRQSVACLTLRVTFANTLGGAARVTVDITCWTTEQRTTSQST